LKVVLYKLPFVKLLPCIVFYFMLLFICGVGRWIK